MFGRMGPWEIALIVVIILIVFGVGKLPQVGGAIGKSIRAFRQGQKEGLDLDEEEYEDDEEEEEEKPKPRKRTTATKKRTKKSS
jgi:sec-independent protein translocase protein TatA